MVSVFRFFRPVRLYHVTLAYGLLLTLSAGTCDVSLSLSLSLSLRHTIGTLYSFSLFGPSVKKKVPESLTHAESWSCCCILLFLIFVSSQLGYTQFEITLVATCGNLGSSFFISCSCFVFCSVFILLFSISFSFFFFVCESRSVLGISGWIFV